MSILKMVDADTDDARWLILILPPAWPERKENSVQSRIREGSRGEVSSNVYLGHKPDLPYTRLWMALLPLLPPPLPG